MGSRRLLELIVAILLPASSLAQPVIHIDDAKGCDGCTVRMRRVTVLSGDGEYGLPRHPNTIVRDSRGRVFTGYGDASVLPRVFGPDGKLIKTFLRKGSGPHEVNVVTGMLLLEGDSLMLVDRDRRYVFDPELQVARTLPAQRGMFDISISGGRRVLMRGGNMQTLTERIAIVDNMGADISEMDIPVTPKGADSYTHMAPGQDDSFWWLLSAEYNVQRWGTNGKRLVTIQRNAPWWSDGTGLQRSAPNGVRPPVSSLNDIREDGQGHLWILAAVPRRTLAVSDSAGMHGNIAPYVLYDTMIEVLDSRTGKLLVSERVAGYFSQLLGGNHLSKLVDDADGHPLVEIWKADLLGVK